MPNSMANVLLQTVMFAIHSNSLLLDKVEAYQFYRKLETILPFLTQTVITVPAQQFKHKQHQLPLQFQRKSHDIHCTY